MKPIRIGLWAIKGTIAAILSVVGTSIEAAELPASLTWTKVVNNTEEMPGGGGKKFNSYNQPSLNSSGYLVFRARSKGPQQPVSGIYARDMFATGGQLARIADRNTTVPAPNNTTYPPDDVLATFNEFPSIPRISQWTTTMATRGNSQPVWTYLVGDEEESRAGTAGIYLNPGGNLITGVGLLGAVPEPANPVIGENYFPYMTVPGAAPGTKFDVFPGSPSLADGNIITFKGNYTDNGTPKTGVFFRETINSQGLLPSMVTPQMWDILHNMFGYGGVLPVQLVANSDTVIPNLPPGVTNVLFGSTAPPSAAGKSMVFVGTDFEDAPTYGGIYLAPLTANPSLKTLVSIGDPVPGETNATFTKFGEALAFDGRYVAFWAGWGEETVTLWLDCPEDGNRDVLAYCAEFYGDNYPVQVPANQGIFVHDTKTGVTHRVARNGGEIADFIYWNFSGKPPGVGGSEEEDDGEPPRWRSTAFIAVSSGPGNTFIVAFKARRGTIDPVENNYLDAVDGIYLADRSNIVVILDTTMDGQLLDPAAPVGSKIFSLAIEREGFRGRWLAVSAGMLEPISTESMAGIYCTKVLTELSLSALGQRTLPFASQMSFVGTLQPSVLFGNLPSQITLNKGNGALSGYVSIGGGKFPVKGKLGANGKAKIKLPSRAPELTLHLTAGSVSGVRVLEMTVTGGKNNYVGLAAYQLDPK